MFSFSASQQETDADWGLMDRTVESFISQLSTDFLHGNSNLNFLIQHGLTFYKQYTFKLVEYILTSTTNNSGRFSQDERDDSAVETYCRSSQQQHDCTGGGSLPQLIRDNSSQDPSCEHTHTHTCNFRSFLSHNCLCKCLFFWYVWVTRTIQQHLYPGYFGSPWSIQSLVLTQSRPLVQITSWFILKSHPSAVSCELIWSYTSELPTNVLSTTKSKKMCYILRSAYSMRD